MRSTPPNTEAFADYFRDHSGSYVIIGGTATLLHIENRDGKLSRATKDLDVVVLDLNETGTTSPFLDRFKEYVKTNGYTCSALSKGKGQAYRYSKPTSLDAPPIIEIISKQLEDTPEGQGAQRVVEFEMSAISLTPDLYELTRAQKTVEQIGELGKASVPIAKVAALILLKAHAYKNLMASESQDDRSKAPKHVLDIARLAAVLKDGDEITVKEAVFKPLGEILDKAATHFPSDKLYQCNWPKNTKPDRVVQVIRERIKATP